MTKAEMAERIRQLEKDRALLLEITKGGKGVAVVRSALRWYRAAKPWIEPRHSANERWLARDCERLLKSRSGK